MIRFIATYRATSLCFVAIALAAILLFRAADTLGAFVILAVCLLAALATYILERRALAAHAPIEAAWKARASYQHMVSSCAIEYAHARACQYTKREARSFLRAHIAAKYPGLSNGERNTVMFEAIEQAASLTLAPAPIKDVNRAPSYS